MREGRLSSEGSDEKTRTEGGKLELKFYPAQVLRRRCRPVQEVNDEVMARAQEMLEFMYAFDGIGLAASQVGWSRRIVTIDPELEKEGARIFVNPLIVHREGDMELEEGCLSLPGVRVKLHRAEKIKVVAYTLAGERVEFEAEDLAACAWQHELDHLNGLLIIDKVPPTTLMTIRDQLKKLEQEGEADGR